MLPPVDDNQVVPDAELVEGNAADGIEAVIGSFGRLLQLRLATDG